MSTILIIDDEAAIRQMLVFTLASEGHECIEAGDAEQAHQLLSSNSPDLILLDWMLPGISGVDFARRIKHDAKTRSIPVIMLSAKGEEADKVRALDTGADDYITKPFSTSELLARIRAVIRRTHADEVRGDSTTMGNIHLDSKTYRVKVGRQPLELSPTEFRLLQYFMTNNERVHSRSQLLDAVWGDEAYVEERTVDVHIRRLRKLLEPSRCDRYIQTVRGVGYRFSVEAGPS